MYGWRARLGVLVPSGNIVTEPEFNLAVPQGVTCHYHRFVFTGGGKTETVLSDIKRAAEYIADAAALMTHTDPSVIAMTGTAVSFIEGYGYDRMLIDRMREKNGNLPTTTTTTSVIDALSSLGVKRVSVAMPYIEEVARALVKFVEGSGFEVMNAKWLDKKGFEISLITPETLHQLAEDVDEPESEALFISCTSLHTFGIIDELERRLKKPVITSNQATLWNMLRLAGINDKIHGYGRLLAEY